MVHDRGSWAYACGKGLGCGQDATTTPVSGIATLPSRCRLRMNKVRLRRQGSGCRRDRMGEFMSAAWTVFRARMRRRWRAWVALALLIGLFAAAVTALAAGARRTDSAYPRLLTWSRAPDLMFYTADSESATFASPSVADIERLPVARATAAVTSYTVLSPGDAEIYAPQTNVIPEVFFRAENPVRAAARPRPGQ